MSSHLLRFSVPRSVGLWAPSAYFSGSPVASVPMFVTAVVARLIASSSIRTPVYVCVTWSSTVAAIQLPFALLAHSHHFGASRHCELGLARATLLAECVSTATAVVLATQQRKLLRAVVTSFCVTRRPIIVLFRQRSRRGVTNRMVRPIRAPAPAAAPAPAPAAAPAAAAAPAPAQPQPSPNEPCIAVWPGSSHRPSCRR